MCTGTEVLELAIGQVTTSEQTPTEFTKHLLESRQHLCFTMSIEAKCLSGTVSLIPGQMPCTCKLTRCLLPSTAPG